MLESISKYIAEINLDVFIFWLFQVFLLLFLITALTKDILNRKGIAKITHRGEESFSYFNYSFTFLTSVVILGIITIPETAIGYKLIIFLIDISICFYLCFWNGWLGNRLISLKLKIQNKVED